MIGVATSTGDADRAWFRVTDGRQWADKPRWSPDGGMLYYIVSSEEGVFNLFRIAFDQSTGRTVGSPMQITSFDSPVRTFSPDIGSSEVGVAAGRLALTIQETSGSSWVLDNVDK